MSLSSAKAKLDAQGGDPVTGYISKTDHQESYDELVDDTALTGSTTAEALDVTGALTAGTIASDATVAGTGLAGGLLSAATPVINGVAAAGTSAIPSRQDHVHAIDTTRAPLASPTFTGTVTIPSGLVLGTVTHTEGTGSPQSVVSAPVGSTYIDTAATTGAIKWVKASGTGNTGWVVEYGDTGWRQMSASLLNSWSTGIEGVKIRRVGTHVVVLLSFTGTSASSDTFLDVPAGFRTNTRVNTTVNSGSSTVFYAEVRDANTNTMVCGSRAATVRGTFSYFTTDAWPSSLPGSAA